MSQPPPPPSQPPSGGFGAPQDPPPGGFGAPQAPPPGGFGAPTPPPQGPPQAPPPPQGPPQAPPQPPQGPPQGSGYGYPQAPPQAPQTPPPAPQGPGYGYPQAPPPAPQGPGYGYPQAPGPAPAGYGYPGQQPQYGYQPPTVPMQPQPPGGGRKGPGATTWIIVAAVAAIALIVGGGVYMYSSADGSDDSKNNSSGTTGGSGGKDDDATSGGTDTSSGEAKEKTPADPSAKVLFQVPAPTITDKQEIDSVSGSWLTDSVYAKAGVGKIVGYDADSGSSTWTLPLPGQTCAASPEISASGIAAVVTESGKRAGSSDRKPCSEVTAFEVATGKKLWTKNVSVGDAKVAFEEVTLSGSTVGVGGLYGGAAFDLSSGKVLWQPKASGCQDLGYAGGEQLVAVRKCGEYGDEKYEVQLLDPKSGNVKWSYKLPAGIDNAKVISSKPVVFGVDSGDVTASGVTDVFSLDDSGKLRTKITLADGKYEHDCGVGNVHDCHAITVGNDKLYVPTKEHDGTAQGSRTNEIVTFSLATGKTAGDKIDAGDDYEIFPMRMDGGNVIAYKDGPYNKGSQVVSVNGTSLKETKLLETPSSDAVRSAISSMVPKSSELLYTDGRLFMGKDLVSKPYSTDQKEYAALGFGAK
ncbi:outer membrane protein assembly factor BamB family protein [Streptomyces avermitilis]|uniref:outer membrane protein assembly factor BamB family protein n=1 Tax=Streptomyces avermitilis TaxID=33903 RepID=UPI003711BC8C